jgi:cytochrome b involved in lipid metabolism
MAVFDFLSNPLGLSLDWNIIVFSFVVVGLTLVFFRWLNRVKNAETKTKTPSSESAQSKQKLTVEKKYFTREEVAKHNRPDDCWLIIKNKVYDVTPFVPHHPGKDKIFHKAGQDNTAGFYGEQHPATVEDLVSTYYIGDLKD